MGLKLVLYREKAVHVHFVKVQAGDGAHTKLGYTTIHSNGPLKWYCHEVLSYQ